MITKHSLFIVAFVLLAACRPTGNAPAAKGTADAGKAEPIRLLVIEDPELAGVIERQWNAHGETPLKIRLVKQDEFLNQQQRRLASDVVIYPSAMIGELASRDWLKPLTEQQLGNEFQWRDIWDLPRLQEIKWGAATMAVPLGSPTLMLCYRPDLFERASISVPKTWADYQNVVQQFADPSRAPSGEDSKLKTWRGTCEPIGGGFAGDLLLARAAAYARHSSQYSTTFDYRDMKPLIAGPPFVRALKELVAAVRAANPTADWEALRKVQDVDYVRKEFHGGACAVAITWPSFMSSEEGKIVDFPIAFAPLPGSVDVYNFRTDQWEQRPRDEPTSIPVLGASGRFASVTTECGDIPTAIRLLSFIAGPELSSKISPVSKHTTLFRESHLQHSARWLGFPYTPESTQQYGETAKLMLNQSACLLSLRIPGRAGYMAALDDAVWASIREKAAPEDALHEAAQKWDALTNELGRDAQRRAYALSIGLEP